MHNALTSQEFLKLLRGEFSTIISSQSLYRSLNLLLYLSSEVYKIVKDLRLVFQEVTSSPPAVIINKQQEIFTSTQRLNAHWPAYI